MFLNEKLVSDKEKGLEILKGTPLRMSSNSDYNTFLKLINQVLLIQFYINLFL